MVIDAGVVRTFFHVAGTVHDCAQVSKAITNGWHSHLFSHQSTIRLYFQNDMTIWVKTSFAVLSNKWVFTCLLVIFKFFCGSSHQMCSLPSPCSPVLNSGFCLLLFDYRHFQNTHKNRIKNTYGSFTLFTNDCYFPDTPPAGVQHVLKILYPWRLSASLALQTSFLQPYWTFSTFCIYLVFMVSFPWNVLLLCSEAILPSKPKSKSLDASLPFVICASFMPLITWFLAEKLCMCMSPIP